MLEYLYAAYTRVAFMDIRNNDEGQTAVEYALVLLLVALVLVAVLAGGMKDVLNSTIGKITGSIG